MEYKTKRERYVSSLEEINQIYDLSLEYSPCTILAEKDYEPNKNISLNHFTWIQNSERYYKITTNQVTEIVDKSGCKSYIHEKRKFPCTYIFDKTGNQVKATSNAIVGRLSKMCYKPKEIADCFERDKDGRIINSAKAILDFNPKYDKTEHPVVVYDLNSAYAGVLVNKIIDTYTCRMDDIVGKNEVGFLLDANLNMVTEGKRATFVFPLIDSPYKDFVKKWYTIKKTAPKGSEDKIKAKQILVTTVGLMQKHNPFLRAYIIHTCNNFIQHFLDKYPDKICMWNTDAIYALEHIPELDALVGDEIGQFKIEYEGLFRQKGLNYQKVDKQETTYRGTINMAFDKEFNILTDELPVAVLPYKINPKTLKLELNKEF